MYNPPILLIIVTKRKKETQTNSIWQYSIWFYLVFIFIRCRLKKRGQTIPSSSLIQLSKQISTIVKIRCKIVQAMKLQYTHGFRVVSSCVSIFVVAHTVDKRSLHGGPFPPTLSSLPVKIYFPCPALCALAFRCTVGGNWRTETFYSSALSLECPPHSGSPRTLPCCLLGTKPFF